MESVLTDNRFWQHLGLQEVEGHHSRTVPISCYVDPCRRFEDEGARYAGSEPAFEQRLEAVRRWIEWGYGYSPGEPGARRAPSAGALYPTEVYVFGYDRGEPRGLYFSFRRHAYYEVEDADCHGLVSQLRCTREGMAIVLGTVLWRTVQRYGVRGYRYCLLDAGAVAFNLSEVLAAVGEEAGVEAMTPTARTERMLGLVHGEACVLGLALSPSAVRALARLPEPPRQENAALEAESEMPPTLSPALRRATMFHARALAAAERA